MANAKVQHRQTKSSSSGSIIERVNISVSSRDVSDQHCDVLILKYAQSFYGADLAVSESLMQNGMSVEEMEASPGEFRLLPSNGALAAHQVLFVGVERLGEFKYKQIRNFSERALKIAAVEVPDAIRIAMTIHGVGYGFDEREAFTSQLSGLLAAIHNETIPPALKQIIIVEHDQARVTRLKRILSEYLTVE